MDLPYWLSEQEASTGTRSLPRRHATGLLEKALRSLDRFLTETLIAESTAKRRGLWQALDPRVKVVSVFSLIALVTTEIHLAALVASYMLVLAFALASRISLLSFVTRVWGFTLLFAGVVVLPLALNPVTPGEPLLVLAQNGVDLGFYRFSGPLTVTLPGLQRASIIILRTGTAASLALLLTLTTPWTGLLRALRALHIPRLVILILQMTMRYVFLLVRVAIETLEARKLRMVGPFNRGEKRAFFGAIFGTIVSRSYALHEAVYEAMLARGYSGEPKVADRFVLKVVDVLWMAAVTVLIAAVIYFDRFLL
jgi:cobalt/nickel transport system permease protein